MMDKPIMIYSKAGGLLNLQDTYEIFPDGRVVTHTPMGGRSIPAQFHISAQELDHLKSLFDKYRFSSLDDFYLGIPEPTLLMTRELTYGGKTVTTTNGGNPPQEFQNLVEGLEVIVR